MTNKKHSKIVRVPAKVKARIKAGITKQHLVPNPVMGGDGSPHDPYTPSKFRANLFSALERVRVKPVFVRDRTGNEVVVVSSDVYDLLLGKQKHPLDG